jgi:ribosomal protein S18 acetylase RimI-like enzyme
LRKIRSFVAEFRWWRIRGGMLKSISSLILRIHSWLFTRWDRVILAGPLPHLPRFIPVAKGITIRPATAADLPALAGMVTPTTLAEFARRFEAGRLCGIAMDGDKIVAYIWAGFEVRPEIERFDFPLLPDEAHLFNGYTLPQYRRMGVMASMLSLLSPLHALGARRIVVTVEKRNHLSMNLCKRLGLLPVGYARYMRLFGRKYTWSQRNDLEIAGLDKAASEMAPTEM